MTETSSSALILDMYPSVTMIMLLQMERIQVLLENSDILPRKSSWGNKKTDQKEKCRIHIKAVYWLQKTGNEMEGSNIYITLAMILRNSEDPSVHDSVKAFEYAQKAVDTGNETALNLMGTFYENN